MLSRIKLAIKVLFSKECDNEPIHTTCPYCNKDYSVGITSIGNDYDSTWYGKLLN